MQDLDKFDEAASIATSEDTASLLWAYMESIHWPHDEVGRPHNLVVPFWGRVRNELLILQIRGEL